MSVNNVCANMVYITRTSFVPAVLRMSLFSRSMLTLFLDLADSIPHWGVRHRARVGLGLCGCNQFMKEQNGSLVCLVRCGKKNLVRELCVNFAMFWGMFLGFEGECKLVLVHVSILCHTVPHANMLWYVLLGPSRMLCRTYCLFVSP